jgi:gliding motility-associated-like protein
MGTILVGKIGSATGNQQGGFLLQLDSADEVVWAKRYVSVIGNEQAVFSKCKSVADGYLVIGRVIKKESNDPSQTIIVKLDSQGNSVWVKAFSFDTNLYPNSELQIQDIQEGITGDIVLAGSIYLGGFSNIEREGFVARVNKSGTLQFARSFAAQNTNINDCFGVGVTGQTIWVFGVVQDGLCSSLDPRSLFAMSLDYLTGEETGLNRYCIPAVSGNGSFADYRHNWVASQTASGFQVCGFLGSTVETNNFLKANFDQAGNITNAFQIQDQELSKGYHNILPLNNGNLLIQSAHKSSGSFQSQYSSTGDLRNQVYFPVEGLYTTDLLSEAGSLALVDSGAVTYALPCLNPGPSIRLFRRNLLPHLSVLCVGTDTAFDQISNSIQLSPNPIRWDKINENPFILSDASLNSSAIQVIGQTVCTDSLITVHLKITGPAEICAGQKEIVFHGSQNPVSGRKVYWAFDSSWMKNLEIADDSTVQVTARDSLHSGSTYYLHAEIENCQFVRDSLLVKVRGYSNDTVILSGDTTICPGSAFTLKTAGKFRSYLWQDGSTDSVFSVNAAGQFRLTAINYCGEASSDTVNVKAGDNCLVGVFFPNAFSPNGDGLNDVFRPIVLAPVTGYILKIYNRYGGLLFESQTPGQGWDGTVNNKEQVGDGYVFFCRYTVNGHQQKKWGTFVLVR